MNYIPGNPPATSGYITTTPGPTPGHPASLPPPQFYYVNTGWVCPKCGRVYSPTTPMCYSCPSHASVTLPDNYTLSPDMIGWPPAEPHTCSTEVKVDGMASNLQGEAAGADPAPPAAGA